MKQLQAGYILDSVADHLLKNFDEFKVSGLLRHLSYFDVEIESSQNDAIANPQQIISVVNNIISRGLPTRISYDLEKSFLKNFNIGELDKRLDAIGAIKYDLNLSKEYSEKLFRALHVIDPRVSFEDIERIKIDTWENHLGSDFEEDFLYNKLPRLVNPFWVQLFETQRELENILRFSTSAEDEIERFLTGTIQIFNEQQVDFSIEYPYAIFNQRGLIVEIDGSQHEETTQKLIDENRDNATEKAKWKRAVRIRTGDWNQINSKLDFFRDLENEELFSRLKENYSNPLFYDEEGKAALQLVLTPYAIARFQKLLVNLLHTNQLDLSKDVWNIAVIERDVPFAQLAVDDFLRTFCHLVELSGQEIKLPKINLYVENSKEFSNTRLGWTKEIDRSLHYDLFLDLSVLQRNNLSSIDRSVEAVVKVKVRSSHSPKTKPSYLTDELIKYKPVGRRNKSTNKFTEIKEQVERLEFLIRDIFRKKGFRPGQLEIMNRAFQGKSVIGLLPTGSGKSLTYQLTVLLQPGMAVVIDPIKSLMKDQYEGLLKNWIDCSLYINSSLSQRGKQLAIERINKANTLFAFISPERLQDEGFRNQLIDTSDTNGNYFSYCVIDEAHCVSEWGHDFRTSYLRLGDNARKYLKAKTGKSIPFFALTATASYDVLADIQRELKIKSDNSIIRLEKLDRKELQFVIKEVVAAIEPELGLGFSNKQALGEAKQAKLISEITGIPNSFNQFLKDEELIKETSSDIIPENFSAATFFQKEGRDNNAGLIFCPHRKWYFGVTDNASKVKEDIGGLKVGSFMGSNGSTSDEINELNQTNFINNKLDLLVATKAFGMGIDKPNIRYVVHFNYPSSIESYYQEAGRAGRDKKIAIGLILFNQQEVGTEERVQKVTEEGEITEEFESFNTTIDRDLLESFHRSNFKGIAKEKVLLAELLTEIKFPTKRVINQLEDSIATELGEVLQLRTYKSKLGKHVLYLNPDFGSIYLDKHPFPFFPGKDAKAKTNDVANFIREYIDTNRPIDQKPFDWLNQFTHTAHQDGIEKLLEDPEKPDSFIVVIPFTNNTKEQIAIYLESKGVAFTERIVDEAQKFCSDGDEFIENLVIQYAKYYKNKEVTIEPEWRPKLKRMFLHIREEQDTFKAIYRLSVLGIIDDYTIDYNSKTISAHISRKRKGHYTHCLKEFLLQYNSIERVEERIKRLPNYKGNTEIQKCLGFLIKFIYEEIASQRKTAIKAMEEACKVGLQENGSKKFKEYIDLYMNSKYAKGEFLPEDTEKGQKEDFAVVEKYIDLVSSDSGGEINNLKHLRGAATMLNIQAKNGNYVFILLKSFSTFILEKENEEFIKEAQNDFYEGIVKLSKTNNEDSQSAQSKIEIFKNKLSHFDTSLKQHIEEIEDIILHRIHTDWMKEFNSKFIGEYERTN